MISQYPTFEAVNITATQTTFSYGFCIQNLSDLKVFNETAAGVRSDWTSYISSVTGVGNQAGGAVTLSTAPAIGSRLFLVRISSFSQLWDASSLNFFDPETVERVVDKLTLLLQETKSIAESAIRLESGEVCTPLARSARKGKLVGFNSTDGSFEYTDKVAFTTSVSDAAVAAIQPSVDAAANSASAASGFADDAATSAQDSADSASAASGFASAASGSASAASGSASNASGFASAASGSALEALGYRNSASSSAAAALNSQNAAAASAATALNAQATEYLGAIAGTAVPATATTKGQYYLITSGGTSQSVTWTVGDKAVYNGTSGSWSRITGFNAASNTYAEGVGATRVGSGYLHSNGYSSNRGMLQIPGGRGNLAGALQASWVGWVEVPSINPVSVPIGIAHLVSSATSVYPTNWSMVIQISTAGALELFAFSNNGFTDRRQSVWAVFRSSYSGQRIWLDVRFTNGSSKPVVFVNGADFTSSFTDAATGTLIPSWLDSGLVATYSHTGYNWPAGVAPIGCWLNLHLTNAESDAWRITGRPPAGIAFGGSRDILYSSNFSLGTPVNNTLGLDGWSEVAGGQTVLHGNVDSVAGVDDTLRILANSGNKSIQVQNGIIFTPSANSQGFEIILDYYADVGSGISSIYFGNFTSPQTNSVAVVEGVWQTGVRFTTNLYTGARFFSGNGSLLDGKSIYLKNVVVRRAGALSLPQIQPGTANVLDATTIGGNDGILTGVTGVTGTDTQLTEAAVDSRSVFRVPSGYLYSDGITASRAQIQTPGSRGNFANAPLASWVGWVDIPSFWSQAVIAGLQSVANTQSNNLTNTLGILGSGNELYIEQRSSPTNSTNIRNFVSTNFRSIYSGQRIWLDVRFTRGSSIAPEVWVNGSNVSGLFTSGSVGTTIPDWLHSGLDSTCHVTGFNWPMGIAPLGCWLNSHLSSAESDTWRLTGRPPVWAVTGGIASSIAVNGDFSLDPTTTNGGSYNLDPGVTWSGNSIVFATAGAAFLRGQNSNLSPMWIAQGKKYHVRAVFTGWSSGTFVLTNAAGSTSEFVVTKGTNSISGNGTLDCEFIYIGSGTRLMLGSTTAAPLTATVDNLEIRQLGAISLPSVQGISVLEDMTVIGGNQARLSLGMTPVLLDTTPVSVIEIPARSFTNGTYVELLGGAIIGPRKRRIVSITGNSTVTGALHVGTTSGGTQILGNVNTTAGDYDVANGSFTSRIVPANSSLFVMFSNTTTASIHIHLTDL